MTKEEVRFVFHDVLGNNLSSICLILI